jgi:polyhydroxyalkanoate synthesis regulator phasin
MANLQDQKKANDKLHQDNQRFHTSYLEMEVERNQIQKALQEKMAEINKTQQQVTKLTGELVERGEQSSNCLENALSDQVEQLKAESESSRGIITELTKVNNGLVKKLEKYKKTLSVLTSDLT